jgi:hypothetical protein
MNERIRGKNCNRGKKFRMPKDFQINQSHSGSAFEPLG